MGGDSLRQVDEPVSVAAVRIHGMTCREFKLWREAGLGGGVTSWAIISEIGHAAHPVAACNWSSRGSLLALFFNIEPAQPVNAAQRPRARGHHP